MHIQQQGDWLKVVRITGPNHHYLGLRFGTDPLSDARPVAGVVREAVAKANADMGSEYQVSEIQIDERDTYRSQIYQMMAYQAVRYAAEHGPMLAARLGGR